MNESDLRELLRQCEFMREFSDSHLDKLAEVAEQTDFAPGSVVFREGELAANIYVIVDGSVSLEIRGPETGSRRILTIGKGDLLGWSPVLGQKRLTATARAVIPTKTIQISASQVLTLCQHDPNFGFEFMRRTALALAKRLSATRLQLLNVYGTEMPTAPEDREE